MEDAIDRMEDPNDESVEELEIRTNALKMLPYICNKCRRIPKLLFHDNQIEVICKCDIENKRMITVDEFMDPKKRAKKCDNCQKIVENMEIEYCLDCKMFFCLNCKDRTHTTFVVNKNHKFNIIGKENDCEECNRKEVNNYCEECLKYICDDCKINHKDHIIKSLSRMKKKELDNKFNNDLKNLGKLYIKIKKLKASIDDMFEKYSKTYNNYKSFMRGLIRDLVSIPYSNFNSCYNLINNSPNLDDLKKFISENSNTIQNNINDIINEKSILFPENLKNFCNHLKCINRNRIIKSLNENSKYEGETHNNKLDGIGKIFFRSGVKAIGIFKEDKANGFGIQYYPNSDKIKYKGDFKNGLFDGYGTYYFMDCTYKGEWKEGKKNGYGIMEYKNGSLYNGEWENDKAKGYGIYEAEKQCYSGEWKSDKKNGLGVNLIYFQSEGIDKIRKYEGNWFNNDPEGLGIVSTSDKNSNSNETIEYEGYFHAGKRNFYGIINSNGISRLSYWSEDKEIKIKHSKSKRSSG